MPTDESRDPSLRHYGSHPRDWCDNQYVYPVISRRSGGLSIGVNLSPAAVCDFNCVYCQVDRSRKAQSDAVDPDGLRRELYDIVVAVQSGALWKAPAFADVPRNRRSVNDFAFSGNAEPTKCPRFAECVDVVAEVRCAAGWTDTKIVLITNAGHLSDPKVVAGLAVMDRNNGQIWAKLDAGTEEYFRKVNRASITLAEIVANITAAARIRPIVIQSLFARLDGVEPDKAELSAYLGRLNAITQDGGRVDHVQVYTVARRPAEEHVAALPDSSVDRIANLIRPSRVPSRVLLRRWNCRQ